MLLGIPGDNTYSNYQEATPQLLAPDRPAPRQPHRQGPLRLAVPRVRRPLRASRPDLDAIEALSTEREALWTRIDKATFLTPDEKRAAVGCGPLEVPVPSGSDTSARRSASAASTANP